MKNASPGEHLVEVLDLLAVPDGLDDGEERLVALLLGRAHNALVVSLVIAELHGIEKKNLSKLPVNSVRYS